MKEILQFLNSNEGAFMVIITVVYVIATVAICYANIKASNVSKEQLDEMKRQYAAENRPIIEMEFCYERRAWYILRFVNRGKTTAQHVRIELEQEFIDSLSEESFQRTLTQIEGKECIIGVNQHYDLYIGSNALRGNQNIKPVKGSIIYNNRGNEFQEDFFLDLPQYMTFFSSTTDEEDLLKTIKAIEKDLKSIKDVLNIRLNRNEDSNKT